MNQGQSLATVDQAIGALGRRREATLESSLKVSLKRESDTPKVFLIDLISL